MKIHFGIMINLGNYESPLLGCEETLCGCTGETQCETAVDVWSQVTCKKCLRLKESYVRSVESEEEAIITQMGEMADFINAQE